MTLRNYAALAPLVGIDPTETNVFAVPTERALAARQKIDDYMAGRSDIDALVPGEGDNFPAGADPKWSEHFVMLRKSAIRNLTPAQVYVLVVLLRVRDNLRKDGLVHPAVLADRTGLTVRTLKDWLTPGGLLSDHVRLRRKDVVAGRVDDLWYGHADGIPRWRLDYTEIEFIEETDETGQTRKRLASADDAFVKAYYSQVWQDPARTGGDRWIRKQYTQMVPDKKAEVADLDMRTEPRPTVAKDVTYTALMATWTVAACADNPGGTRCTQFGIKGLATMAGVGRSVMTTYLAAAEDNGLLRVENRRGRDEATRTVLLAGTDRRSPEARPKRSHGPTKRLNAPAQKERRLKREAREAARKTAEVDDSDVLRWLRDNPVDALDARDDNDPRFAQTG
jgi:hypothetical protein